MANSASVCLTCLSLLHRNIQTSSGVRTIPQLHRSLFTTTKQPTFGIIAALTTDGVIGIDGGLPWKIISKEKDDDDLTTGSIPLDRDRFVTVTRNKILILGRKTFAEEDPSGGHVKHARVCIVVSKTMNPMDHTTKVGTAGPTVMIARSFNEALDMASNELSSVDDEPSHTDEGEILKDKAVHNIQCWVAGGEMIYKEALQHCNAAVIHLTHVDMAVKNQDANQKHDAITHFPMEYLEKYNFQEICRESTESSYITFCLYKKHCRK